ncbi:glycosyltransferase [uncultured Endozoicomonas sp.]|uniref:glycosyltransferase n=1 Tax=uncultured Endozoicomonas sp. TaxID=432652 RepID=UPI00261D9472|nr:glycosyltransferase [uncultured Endozoicomonas sp.]
MNNLHISLTEFRNESRVLKEVDSISSLQYMQHVYIASLHGSGLSIAEKLSGKISLKRMILKTRILNKGLFAQIIKYIEFSLKVFFYYRNKNIDLINIHSLGLLPLGYFLKIFYKARLIYDTHELETETNGLNGLRKKLAKIIERFLIDKVDHIFVVSENIADWYQKKYGIQRPTVVMNAPKSYTVENNQYFRNKFELREDQLIVLYQGGLAPGRGIDLLLETFSLRTDDKVIIVFMGYGVLEKLIQDTADKYNTVFFHKAVQPKDLLNYTASADIGISPISNTCLSYYFCMPNKLFEYAMAGLPVLVSNMKEMREFVEKYRIGWVIEDETIDSINQAIDKIVGSDMRKFKNNARLAALENAWEHQALKMLVDYNFLLGGK